jgi:hypothetical protein
MKVPGFTADASLTRTSAYYRTPAGYFSPTVLAQMLPQPRDTGPLFTGLALGANLQNNPCNWLALCCAAGVPACCTAFLWRCVLCPAILACCLAGNVPCCKAWVAAC